VNLGSPLGLCACSALFSGLLLESLLSVVGHSHGRERVCRYDMDIMIVRWTADGRTHHQTLQQKASQIPMKRQEEKGEERDLRKGSCPWFMYSWLYLTLVGPLMGGMMNDRGVG